MAIWKDGYGDEGIDFDPDSDFDPVERKSQRGIYLLRENPPGPLFQRGSLLELNSGISVSYGS